MNAPDAASRHTTLVRDSIILQTSLAFVWAATGLLVVSPTYRSIGEAALATLGLPSWLMWLACAGEVVLAIVLASAAPLELTAWLQIAAVAGFTAVLAVSQPLLLASPFGVLTKNLPFVTVAYVAARLPLEGWTPRLERLLAWGCGIVWLTEGVVPKLLLQQGQELSIVDRSGLSFGRPDVVLALLGVAEAVSFALALWAPQRVRIWVLTAQAAALVVLPLWVGALEPVLFVHPFGPLTKNVPLLAGTWLLRQRLRATLPNGPQAPAA